jgi:hypothetical protein
LAALPVIHCGRQRRPNVPKDEAAVEAEIQATGLNARRLNPAHIDAQIAAEAYHVFPGTTPTVCALTLRNGFLVIGESATASRGRSTPTGRPGTSRTAPFW